MTHKWTCLACGEALETNFLDSMVTVKKLHVLLCKMQRDRQEEISSLQAKWIAAQGNVYDMWVLTPYDVNFLGSLMVATT